MEDPCALKHRVNPTHLRLWLKSPVTHLENSSTGNIHPHWEKKSWEHILVEFVISLPPVAVDNPPPCFLFFPRLFPFIIFYAVKLSFRHKMPPRALSTNNYSSLTLSTLVASTTSSWGREPRALSKFREEERAKNFLPLSLSQEGKKIFLRNRAGIKFCSACSPGKYLAAKSTPSPYCSRILLCVELCFFFIIIIIIIVCLPPLGRAFVYIFPVHARTGPSEEFLPPSDVTGKFLIKCRVN